MATFSHQIIDTDPSRIRVATEIEAWTLPTPRRLAAVVSTGSRDGWVVLHSSAGNV